MWEEDGFTFFVDGVQSGEKLTGVCSDTEEFILLGTECIGYRSHIPGFYASYDGMVKKNDKFVVDYVRGFDKVQ